MIAGLISLWNICGMGCDVVAILRVGMVVYWGFMVLVCLCL